MTWIDDDRFWVALDDYTAQSWPSLKQLLDVLYEHKDDLEIQAQAFLFGGLGKFVRIYHELRQDLNKPEVCFSEAFIAVQKDRRIQMLSQLTAEQMVDKKVQNMRGE